MGLQVWLPLNGDLHNQGLANITATNNGATVDNNGKIGKCYSFDGNSLYGDWSEINTLTQMSGCCWVYLNNLSSAQYFFHLGGQSSYPCKFSLDYEGSIRFQINGTEYISGITLTTGIWYHLAITWNGTMAKLYVNGIESYSKSATGSFSASNHFAIGARTNGTAGNTFAYAIKNGGKLNDIRFYDHALSPREVKQVSAALVLHYPLSMPGQENMAVGTKNLSVTAYKSNMNCSKRGTSTVRLNDYGFYESQVTNSFGGLCVYANQYNFQVGDTVTMSFYIYTNGSTKSYSFYPMMYNSSGTRDTSTGIQTSIDGGAYTTVNAKSFGSISSTVPERHYVTFIWNQNVKDIIDNGGSIELSIQIHGNWQTGDWGSIFGLKFERGSRPTPWLPNPADAIYSALGFNDGIEYDVSGYGHNGTKYGAITYDADTPRYETSAVFDGSSDIRSAKSSFGWFDFKEGTVAAWFKPANTTQKLASVGVQNDSGARSRSFSICNYSGKAATVVGYDSSWENQSSGYSMAANTWYHLCATITNGDTVKLYVNGELVQTRTVTNTTGTIASTTQFAVGVDLPGSDERFTGQLSDVRFYTTCLSPQDVRDLYAVGASLSDTGVLFSSEVSEI